VSFGRPEFLWFFLVVSALIVWSFLARHGRARAWITLAQRGRAPGLRSISLLTASLLVVLAIARPKFGPVVGPPLPPGHDVVLMMDTSRSMGAEDAVPNRLAVAVESAVSLVNALAPEPANRAAVVAFAGRGVPRCPLTENLGAVIDVLKRLQVGSVQPGGTDLAAGLDAAIEAFGKQEHAEGRSIVVFSDGEDLADHWRSRVDRLVRAGIIVHVAAIGDTEEGHPVPSDKPDQPLTFEGQKVLSKRIDTALETIAGATEGAVLKLGLAPIDLGTLYRGRIAPVARLKRESMRVPERTEQFPLFLTAAMRFALAGCWPAGRLGPLHWAWARATAAIVLLGFSAAFLGAGQGGEPAIADVKQAVPQSRGVASSPLGVSPGHSAAQFVAHGQASYAAGHLAEALANFEAAITAAPLNSVPRYNAAATLFQLRRYQEAFERYLEARQQAGAVLRTKIDYALGNTALILGEIPAAVSHYDRCLASQARGPDLDTVRRDAAINRQYALEQAPPSLASEGETDSDQATRQRGRPPGPRPPGRGDDESSPDEESTSGSPPDGSNPQDRGDTPPKRRSRTGGGGGANKNTGPPGESPDDRLNDALDRIRDALSRRLPDETSSESSAKNRKDW
jgi:Ca-activated chloride channel homolog